MPLKPWTPPRNFPTLHMHLLSISMQRISSLITPSLHGPQERAAADVSTLTSQSQSKYTKGPSLHIDITCKCLSRGHFCKARTSQLAGHANPREHIQSGPAKTLLTQATNRSSTRQPHLPTGHHAPHHFFLQRTRPAVRHTQSPQLNNSSSGTPNNTRYTAKQADFPIREPPGEGTIFSLARL